MLEVLSTNPETVSVKLELPWRVAQELVKHGPAILNRLSEELEKQQDKDARANKLAALHNGNAKTSADRWKKLGRHAERLIRKRIKETDDTPARALSYVAKELGVQYSALQPIVLQYRADLREKVQARRDANIIRLYFLGHSDTDIAKMVRPNIGLRTVGRILSNHKELIKGLRAYRQPAELKTDAKPVLRISEDAAPGKPRGLFQVSVDRKQQLDAWGMQTYRALRKKKRNANQRYQFLKEFSSELGIPHALANSLLSMRIRKVRLYIQKRRDTRFIELEGRGLTIHKIADRMALHPTTVKAISRRVRTSHTQNSEGAQT